MHQNQPGSERCTSWPVAGERELSFGWACGERPIAPPRQGLPGRPPALGTNPGPQALSAAHREAWGGLGARSSLGVRWSRADCQLEVPIR